MKLNIDFEELIDAYEDSSVEHMYNIDTKNNKIIPTTVPFFTNLFCIYNLPLYKKI